MKKYLVPDAVNPQKLAIIGASGFVPHNMIAELPEDLYEEEVEWLVVNDEIDDFGNVSKVVIIDEAKKAQIISERQALIEEYNAKERAKKRLGELTPQLLEILEKFLKTQNLSPEDRQVIDQIEAARLELKSGVEDAGQ
jgi:putative NADH-flavin reductase